MEAEMPANCRINRSTIEFGYEVGPGPRVLGV